MKWPIKTVTLIFCLLLLAIGSSCRTPTEQEKPYEEQLAAAKKADDLRLAAQRKAEAERLSKEKKRAQEQLAAQRKAAAARQAEVQRLAKLKQEAQHHQNEEAQRLEHQLEEAWKAKQAEQARKEAQAAHRAQLAQQEAKDDEKPPQRDTSAKKTPLEVYLLRIGDGLEISVWGHANLTTNVQVREDGTFPFPLIGDVPALYRSIREVEQEVQDRLNRDFIVNPQVTARLTGAKFSIIGEVERPGQYPIEGFIDLLTAISLAGGINKFGSGHIEIIRLQGGETVRFRANIDRITHGKEPNVTILPHDTIQVQRRLF